ncbi:uncharacterized protein LOC115331535, partial [Ixodes scapularis]|uniref:uncharacterized protein LOC115331535 n=1 Tax=Ixodes scapularis TaxID=6945 RepID=UPI001A9DFBCD
MVKQKKKIQASLHTLPAGSNHPAPVCRKLMKRPEDVMKRLQARISSYRKTIARLRKQQLKTPLTASQALEIIRPHVSEECKRERPKANNTLEKLAKWLTHNKLVPNIAKTNYIIFAPKNKLILNIPQLSFASINITRVYHTKFLGLTLDHQLTWHQHVKDTTNKIYRNIPILYKLRHIFSLRTPQMLYHSLIHTHISYGLSFYGLTYKTTLKPIELAQNTTLRAMPFVNRRESAQFAYRFLNILTVNQCLDYRVALLTLK